MTTESVFLVGLSHLSAPVAARERASVSTEALAQALDDLKAAACLGEAVLLSTCSRVEVAGVARDPKRAAQGVCRWFLERAGRSVEGHLYVRQGRQAVRHVFRVASGLDSWIIGESEILGQIKQAYQAALALGFTGRALNKVFQRAASAGKYVRAATGLQSGIHSIGGAAALAARRVLGPGAGGAVVVFGAGRVAEAVVRHLAAKGPGRIIVANRTLERAVELAATLGGEAVGFEDGLKRLAEADAAVFSTSSEKPLLRATALAGLRDFRARPLFLIDLGVPRNVAADCSELDGVHLHDLDRLREMVRASMEGKAASRERAEMLSALAAEECALEIDRAPGPPACAVCAAGEGAGPA